jgi:hypothetical protein
MNLNKNVMSGEISFGYLKKPHYLAGIKAPSQPHRHSALAGAAMIYLAQALPLAF